jgi:hypothetical protein
MIANDNNSVVDNSNDDDSDSNDNFDGKGDNDGNDTKVVKTPLTRRVLLAVQRPKTGNVSMIMDAHRNNTIYNFVHNARCKW